MNQSDEIKEKLDIVDIIREYIPLKAAGMNFRALCPFHREKSPSFMVSPEKQIWHCFGCGKGGDVFSFVMEMENISFVDVLKQLAPRAGVTLKRQDPKLSSERNRLLDIMELCCRYYHKVFTDSKEAKSAREYLEKRDLSIETQEKWRIGYSPESWDDVVSNLKKKGYSDKEIFSAGMSVKKEGTNRYYNRFRGRVMFPIFDMHGAVVGFTARVSPEKEKTEKMGKYINSPQTMIYDKSKVIFGLNNAKLEIKSKNQAIVVEGQMDVITAHQHGYKNVIASSGTALTAEQIKIIKRYTDNIIFALDADSAGQVAIERGEATAKDVDYAEVEAFDQKGQIKKYINPLLSFNLNIKVIDLGDAKDPDELIKDDPKSFQKKIDQAKPIMEHYFAREVKGRDMDSVDAKKEVARNLLAKIIRLNDSIEQDYWIKRLSQLIGAEERYLREALEKTREANNKKYSHQANTDARENKIRKQNREEGVSEFLLALLLKFPSLIEYSQNHLQNYQIYGSDNQNLYKNLLIYYNKITENLPVQNQSDIDSVIFYKDFLNWIEKNEEKQGERQALGKKIEKCSIIGDRDYYEFDYDEARKEAINTVKNLKKIYLSKRIKEITEIIAEAETDPARDKGEIEALMGEMKILSSEMSGLQIND